MLAAIEGFSGYYVSSEGDVYCTLGKGSRDKSKRVEMYKIKPRYTHLGYGRVCMREDKSGLRKDRYIHRLVASAFIPNPENKPCVNHFNCNRGDNRVENLEWCTVKENTDYTLQMHHIERDSLGRMRTPLNSKIV